MNWSYYFDYVNGKLRWNKKPKNDIKTGDEAGNVKPNGYRIIVVNSKPYLAHRITWELFNGEIQKGMVIDHINGVRDDNRIENLQLVTRKQNNQRKYTTRTKGYSVRNRPFPYQAQKTYNTKRYSLGYFGTPCGATMAHNTFFINNKGI